LKNDIVNLDETNCVEKLSKQDWNILFEFDEENNRKGDFKRIYPNPHNIENYTHLFGNFHYSNFLVQKWLDCPKNFLELICKKKVPKVKKE